MEQDDPVKAAFGGSEDLYDVATWDVRTQLDEFAVSVHAGLRRARTAVVVLVALVLFLAQVAIAGALVAERPSLGLLALFSVVPAFLLAAYLWYGDPTRREPPELLAVTFLLAVLFASFAAVVNTVLFPLFGLFSVVGLVLFFFLVVGPIEEAVKWLAIRTYAYRSDRFDAVVDGVVYGAVAGLGFAAIENLAYIVQAYMTTGAGAMAQLQFAVQAATQRAFVGPGHVIYSAFAGYYLGLAKFNPRDRGPIVVKGLLVAAGIHALYNTLVSLLPLAGVSFVAFVLVYDGFFLALLYRKVSRYRRYYYRALAAGGEADPAAPGE